MKHLSFTRRFPHSSHSVCFGFLTLEVKPPEGGECFSAVRSGTSAVFPSGSRYLQAACSGCKEAEGDWPKT